MLQFKKVLCPVDFSSISRRALDHAAEIARWYEAELTVLHVVPLMPTVFGYPSPVALPAEPATTEAVLRELTTFAQGAAEVAKRTTTFVREGSPAVEVLHYAVEHDTDLVVLGTHGRSGFERFMVGSVAEKVLRKAPCPVLTVPPRAESAPETPVFRRIACGIDFSPAADKALAHALSLAQEANARLTLVHVVDWMADEDLGRYPQFDANGYRRMVTRDARERLEALVPSEARNWCEIEVRVVCGKPYREILRVADAEEAELVVLGVHGANAGAVIDRVLFGSTAAHVIRQASCPVLTVRP
jgi:nucleotide-binding universal stress UspA family protein